LPYEKLSRCIAQFPFFNTPQFYSHHHNYYLSYIEVIILDTDKQALLNYLLGNGIQQEKPASHVIRQGQTNYSQGNTKAIPVPTREEIEAQRRKEAAKAAANAAPQAFAPMTWSQLGSPQQPESTANAAKPAPKVTAPLWEHVKKN
jgi:hypothetical protein